MTWPPDSQIKHENGDPVLPPEIRTVITNFNQRRSHHDPYKGDADCPESRAAVPFPRKTFKSRSKILGIDRPFALEDGHFVAQKSV